MEKFASSFCSAHETNSKWFRNEKKPYYLAEAMQFTIPYIKTLSSTTGNVPNIPEENEDQELKKNDDLHDSQPLSPHQPPTPNIPITSVKKTQPTIRPKTKCAFKNNAVDKIFVEYLEAKKVKIVIPIAILNKIQKLKQSKCSF